jgi:hypothetical protein
MAFPTCAAVVSRGLYQRKGQVNVVLDEKWKQVKEKQPLDAIRREGSMGIRNFIPSWSTVRQLRSDDRLGLGKAAQSSAQANLRPRTVEADRVAKSIYPYCAVGCASTSKMDTSPR